MPSSLFTVSLNVMSCICNLMTQLYERSQFLKSWTQVCISYIIYQKLSLAKSLTVMIGQNNNILFVAFRIYFVMEWWRQ